MTTHRISSSFRRWAKAEPQVWLPRYAALYGKFLALVAEKKPAPETRRWSERNKQRIDRLRLPSRGFAPHWRAIDRAFLALIWLFETYATVAKWTRRRFSKPQTAGSNPAGGSTDTRVQE